MAVTITEDIIGGAKYSLNKDGGTLVRVFTVEGLAATNGANVFQGTVIQDSTTGKRIPQYGQGHPTIAGISVSNISSTPLMKNDKMAVRVEVTYVSQQLNPSSPTFVKVEITGSNGTETFNRWPMGTAGVLDGEIMIIPYCKDPTVKFPNKISPKDVQAKGGAPAQAAGGQIGAGLQNVAGGLPQIFYDYASFSQLTPNTILTFTRQRAVTPATGTLALSKKIRRKVNSRLWNDGNAGTWLCRNMTSTLLGVVPVPGGPGFLGNQLYEERYEFEWDPEGWNSQIALFKSSINGQPPSGISIQSRTGNGYLEFPGYDEIDFDLIGLPNVF